MALWSRAREEFAQPFSTPLYIDETYSHVRRLWQGVMQNPGHTSEWGIANLLTLSALPQGYSSCVCVQFNFSVQ